MVEAISAFAGTTGIPAFYVSFVVTPLASNASEVIASLRFATKKSVNCVTLSLSSLYGTFLGRPFIVWISEALRA